jgi:uncharacterized protein YjbI with pentapeptide repeats
MFAMANQEQVALLKRGSEVWNRWREKNPEVKIDLHKANFRDAVLGEANLRDADLNEAEFSGVYLTKADLCEAILVKAYFNKATLDKANLNKANLSRGNFYKAHFREADLREAELSGANLRGADLCGANLCRVNLSEANLRGANLRNANLSEAILSGADLSNADLSEAILLSTILFKANLSRANLSDTDLNKAFLDTAILVTANLSNANLSNADLNNANLTNANLSNADLSNANLSEVKALGTNFRDSTLTGISIQDWNINGGTIFDGVVCAYIFQKYDRSNQQPSGRRPINPGQTFALGEFTQLYQVLRTAIETIEVSFPDGIDWKAFFQSFKDLREQYRDAEVSIQGIERKAGIFVVRLETSEKTDKGAIETRVKELYQEQLKRLEDEYEERLQLKGAHLEDVQNILAEELKKNTQLLNIVETMADKQNNVFIGNKFGGGFAAEGGLQIGGKLTDKSLNINNSEDISHIIASLRDVAQSFPEQQKNDVLGELEDLEHDLKTPENQNPERVGRRLKRLLVTGTALATLASGAASFSGDINKFTGNVLELTKKLGLPVELIQPDKID